MLKSLGNNRIIAMGEGSGVKKRNNNTESDKEAEFPEPNVWNSFDPKSLQQNDKKLRGYGHETEKCSVPVKKVWQQRLPEQVEERQPLKDKQLEKEGEGKQNQQNRPMTVTIPKRQEANSKNCIRSPQKSDRQEVNNSPGSSQGIMEDGVQILNQKGIRIAEGRRLSSPLKHREITNFLYVNKVGMAGLIETKLNGENVEQLMARKWTNFDYISNHQNQEKCRILLIWKKGDSGQKSTLAGAGGLSQRNTSALDNDG
ncbi:OLC1v1019393C1 [Oldenlandia corymbosa var. corymbosa]|uniref:OLC1v1019393C1 n=1 Tax=Oldenlandia corymbosa var. corymbosa TaxID=529605 RepID=A0AAV1EDZ2_OLDCO|nr:OLC1v1019393C1 [Oldenlandia corymbosa var. corymbosa]